MSISLNCLRNPFSTARAELGDGAVASRFLSDTTVTMIRRGQRSLLSLSHRHRRISAFSIIRRNGIRAGGTLVRLSDRNLKIRNHEMSLNDGDLVDRMAKKHSVSSAAVQVVLAALRSGGGRMAQFSHADFGGMSQWSPGMSMVGDMFNSQLKAKLNALCTDLVAHLDSSEAAGGASAAGDEVSYRSPERSADWWPAGLGRPGAVGAQNDLRYAVFPQTCRLVIDDQGAITVYDTGFHRIFGIAQAQSTDRTLAFTSQDGLVRIADLPKVTG
jgi:hypothetical protein